MKTMSILNHKFDFKSLAQWSAKNQPFSIGLIISFLLLLSYVFYLKPGIGQYYQSQYNIVKLNEKLQIQQQELQALTPKIIGPTQDLTLLKKVSCVISTTQLLTVLTQLIQQQGIRLQNLQPRAIQQTPAYIIQPIHSIITGNYQQLRLFVDALAHLPFLLIINHGNITPINSSQNLTFDFVLQYYRLPIAIA